MKRVNLEKEHEWRERFKEFNNSNLSIAAFCRAKGISDRQFYKWREKLNLRPNKNSSNSLRKVSSDIVPQKFIELKDQSSTSSGVWFDFGNGAHLMIDKGFDSHTLQQIISTLKSC